MVNRSITGSVAFAANNSAIKFGFAYREPGSRKLIAWLTRGKKEHGKQMYSNGSISVLGLPSGKIWGDPTAASETSGSPAKGVITYEPKPNSEGKTMRGESDTVFRMGAEALRAQYPMTDLHPFANVHDDADFMHGTKDESRKNFMRAVRAMKTGRDYFAYFGHGDKSVLVSADLWKNGEDFSDFLGRLKAIVKPGGTICLYACSTGAPNGFAQAVSSELKDRTVFGHLGAGDARTRPFVIRYNKGIGQSFEQLLGDDFKAWASYIKSCSDIWRRFPWMTIEEIRSEVRDGVAHGHHADDYNNKDRKDHHHKHALHERHYGSSWDKKNLPALAGVAG